MATDSVPDASGPDSGSKPKPDSGASVADAGAPSATPGSSCGSETHGSPTTIRRLTQAEYGNAIYDLFGISSGEIYPAAYGKSLTGFSTEPGINSFGEGDVELVMHAAEAVAEALPSKWSELLTCPAQDRECATQFLDTFGRRALRHTLGASDEETLLVTYDAAVTDGATGAEALSIMTAHLLQMPDFLYVVEKPATADQDRPRDAFELATLLALHFWASVPDDALLDAAADNSLSDPDVLRAQAERMVQDARADRTFVRFFREWTGTSRLNVTSKDTAAFPFFDEDFAASMNESFDRFVVDQVRKGATLEELLTTSSVFVDRRLSRFLGLPTALEWEQTTLPSDRYSGLLSQPAVLAALAHSNSSSFVFRGAFIRQRILCDTLGVPPGNALSTFAELERPEDPTGKDESAAVRARLECAPCHVLIDPAGLAFEHFDALGGYRESYASGKAIDPSGTLPTGDGNLPFADAVELTQQLSTLPSVSRCFARQMFRFREARPDASSDLCSVEQIANALSSGGSVQHAFVEAALTDAARYRRGMSESQ